MSPLAVGTCHHRVLEIIGARLSRAGDLNLGLHACVSSVLLIRPFSFC